MDRQALFVVWFASVTHVFNAWLSKKNTKYTQIKKKRMKTKENAKKGKERMRQKETTGGRNRKARKKDTKEKKKKE